MLGRFVSTFAALLLAGCARNAVLEVEIRLPPLPGTSGVRYAVVQFETGDATFEQEWERTSSYPGSALGAEPQTVRYSVVAESPHAEVLVKVLFCTTPDCSAIEDAEDRVPSLWYRLEHPLYIGERTFWRAHIDEMPGYPAMSAIVVDKCEIEGCIRGVAGKTRYCRLDGAHFCE